MAVAAFTFTLGIAATSVAVGATTPRHVLASAPHAVASHATVRPLAVKSYTFNASYSGTISILWNSTGPSTAKIAGKGRGIEFGFITLTGSGSGTASAQSIPVSGKGTLSGLGESLILKITHGTATAAAGTAPTTVAISATVAVVKGAGKFAGAIGTLHVSGAFKIKSTSGSEKDTFSATLKGLVKVPVH
jgi:hypothetical protein